MDITDFSGLRGARGPAGQDGIDGIDGVDGVDGRGITSIAKTGSSGNIDTYTILYTDNTSSTFNVTNGTNGSDGRSIVSITKTGTSGNVDTYTIMFSDNTTSSFTVTNGNGGGGNAWTKISSNGNGSVGVNLSPNKVYEVCVVGRHPMGDFTPCSTPVFFLNTDTSFMNFQTIICPALDDSGKLCVLQPVLDENCVGNWTDFTVEWYFADQNGSPDTSASYGVDFYYREV